MENLPITDKICATCVFRNLVRVDGHYLCRLRGVPVTNFDKCSSHILNSN